MATYFIVIVLGLVVMLLCILQAVQRYSLQNRSATLLEEANIAAGFAGEYIMGTADVAAFSPAMFTTDRTDRVMLLDKDSRVLFDSGASAAQRGKILSAPWVLKAFSGENVVNRTEENGEHLMEVAVPVYSGRMVVGVLFSKSSTEDLYTFFAHIRYRLVVIGIAASLLVGLFCVFVSAIFSVPISRLTGQIKEMSETDAHKLENIRGGNEITELVSAFNLMVERIDDLDNRRQEFVSNASHELKTPLSSIKLICDSLLQNPDTDRAMVNEFLADMNGQVDRLTRIVNKLLSLTKLDSFTEEETEAFSFSTLNLQILVQNVVRALSPLAENKNIMIETHMQESVFLRVDADKIWEAVYNILDNSIKYTPEDGRVYVELYRDEDNVYITVSDNGIGMAEGEVSKIFDRFYRVDKARARETGGTGLGLSIALSAVELHGGYIEVESREEEGSLFRIVLPVTNDL
ncbi:MAG: HAMP domain-containing protein [Ruminococcaceae bacterium]|nr:HAMP domain-containing protein [Oscillospiraceae bacterium]